MDKKNIAIIACVLFLGLIIIYAIINTHTDVQVLTGALLVNGQPDNRYSAFAVYNDKMLPLELNANGSFSMPVDTIRIKEIRITYDGEQVASYGPPFKSEYRYDYNVITSQEAEIV